MFVIEPRGDGDESALLDAAAYTRRDLHLR